VSSALIHTHRTDLHLDPLVNAGPISHVGVVVDDLDAAIAFYGATFGVGPFHVVEFDGAATDYFHSYGQPARPKMRAALYYSGDFFLELVQVTEGETVHTKFFGKHGEGMQHLCFMIDGMDDALAKLATQGIVPVLDYRFSRGEGADRMTIREVYLNTGDRPGGTTIQLLERTSG
jgi:methylmalonyl-CoA/ethylmalonyl-CoA epimerase